MYRKLSILGAVLGVLMLAGASGVHAGDRYRFFDARFSLGGVEFDIGYDSHRGGTLFLRTVHDFYDHPQYRCGSSCARVDRYVHHDYTCPRLGRFFRRHGYRTLDVIPPRIAVRFNRYGRYDDYDYRYRDPYTRLRYRRGDDDDDDYRHREGYRCDKRSRRYYYDDD